MRAALLGAAFFLLCGCAVATGKRPPFGADGTRLETWAAANGWQASRRGGPDFSWLSLSRVAPGSRRITVYIEGDGAPWASPYHPPADPTPQPAIGLDLAARDPSTAVVYLGRPCQYLPPDALAACAPAYWLDRRFAAEVVAAYDRQLDDLRARFNAPRLRLVGYSGGGVIAALLAARRGDVEQLITLAAPLSLQDWVAHHALTPLSGSQDPGALPVATPWPPMQHLVGGDDAIVPAAVVQAFAARHGGRVRVIDGVDHVCCWGPLWSAWLAEHDKELP